MKRFAVASLFLLAPAAFGWTAASDRQIGARAAALGPPDLRLVLDRFQTEYQEGLRLAEASEGTDEHQFFAVSRSGKLNQRIAAQTASIIQAIRRNAPMPLVVRDLGVLTHLVADLNNPFHVANQDPRTNLMHDDFEQYFERKMARFQPVFYGLERNLVPERYVEQVADRTLRLYPLLTSEYFSGSEGQTSQDFDDQSTAFGVASICYSHAVTDLVNLYYYVWTQAGGSHRLAPGVTINGSR